MRKIFITGASGCIGHYLFDYLSKDPQYQLFLLVKNPKKLKFNPADFANVTVIQDDLKNITKYANLLKEIDYLVHLAADWGGREGNYDYSLELFKLLDPQRCQKVIYFSTASILGPDHNPLPEAEKFGTHYIWSKYQFYKKLPELEIYPKVTTIFLTWVLGGDARHPHSHALQGILDLRKWLWFIRFFTVDAHFHFIHAQEVAIITKYLLENDIKEKELVLGNPAISASEFIWEVCQFFGLKVFFQIPIPLFLIKILAFLTRRKLHSWDLYCLQKRNFIYQVKNAANFGLPSDVQTISQILARANLAHS